MTDLVVVDASSAVVVSLRLDAWGSSEPLVIESAPFLFVCRNVDSECL